jgi:hypothetical protein
MSQQADETKKNALERTVSEKPVEETKAETIDSSTSDKGAAEVEEIRTDEAPAAKTHSRKGAIKKKEPDPNPVTEDPYEWYKCTITIVRAALPDDTVSVSVLNHKDEPIIRTFPKAVVLLSDDIERTVGAMRSIWKDTTISTTLAFLPVANETDERTVVISTRPGGDTTVLNTTKESELVLPPPITQMLDELRSALPARALAKLEKDARAKKPTMMNRTAKTKPGTTATSKPAASNKPETAKNQMKLF